MLTTGLLWPCALTSTNAVAAVAPATLRKPRRSTRIIALSQGVHAPAGAPHNPAHELDHKSDGLQKRNLRALLSGHHGVRALTPAPRLAARRALGEEFAH